MQTSNIVCVCLGVQVVVIVLVHISHRDRLIWRWSYISGSWRPNRPWGVGDSLATLGRRLPARSKWHCCRVDDGGMTASKNANLNAGGHGGGGGGSTSATTSDGDYRLVPHEVLTSPTTSYEVRTAHLPRTCHVTHTEPVCRYFPNLVIVNTGWPLTWKTWKSQGIPKWSGKSQWNWNLLFGLWTSWRVEVAAFGSLWAWTSDMFIIDTLVAFSKLVTILVIINVKQQLFKRYAVIFTCPGYWISQGISCGLESGHPVNSKSTCERHQIAEKPTEKNKLIFFSQKCKTINFKTYGYLDCALLLT